MKDTNAWILFSGHYSQQRNWEMYHLCHGQKVYTLVGPEHRWLISKRPCTRRMVMRLQHITNMILLPVGPTGKTDPRHVFQTHIQTRKKHTITKRLKKKYWKTKLGNSLAQDLWSLKSASFYGKGPSHTSWWLPKGMMDLSKNYFVVPWRIPAERWRLDSQCPLSSVWHTVILATHMSALLSTPQRVCANTVYASDRVNAWKSTHFFCK